MPRKRTTTKKKKAKKARKAKKAPKLEIPEGAVGITCVDPSSEGRSNYCRILVRPEARKELNRGSYVEITDGDVTYIGKIAAGPFNITESFEKAVVEMENGNMPEFYTVYDVELVGTLKEGRLGGVYNRPAPGSPVMPAKAELVQEYIGAKGDLYLGRLAAQFNVPVQLSSDVLNKHLAVFGTTGSGKSNTMQVIMEEALKQGFAILVFDVEGEYVYMDQPTDKLVQILKEFGREPEGVKDIRVYVPKGCGSARPDAKEFGVLFKNMDKRVLCEILGVNVMQRMLLLDVINELEKGVLVGGERVEALAREVSLREVISRIEQKLDPLLNPDMPQPTREEYMRILIKLYSLRDQGIFDEAEEIDVEDILVPGRLTVIDISEATDDVRNIVMAHYLDKIFEYKIRNPESAKIMIVMEEAHTFVSREKRDRMVATVTMINELARRGRKRGVCLCFVSQQPSHLPEEIFELCNTRIIHKTSSVANIRALEESTGGVGRELWESLTGLGKGESIIISPNFNHAVIMRVRPAASKRLHVEEVTIRTIAA